MKALKSRRGSITAGTHFLGDLFLLILMLSTVTYALYNFGAGDIMAMNYARNLGATIDASMMYSGDVTIVNECPSKATIIIEGNSITAFSREMVGSGEFTYYYMAPKDANLPDKTKISCSMQRYITIKKTLDPETLQVTITIE